MTTSSTLDANDTDGPKVSRLTRETEVEDVLGVGVIASRVIMGETAGDVAGVVDVSRIFDLRDLSVAEGEAFVNSLTLEDALSADWSRGRAVLSRDEEAAVGVVGCEVVAAGAGGVNAVRRVLWASTI